MHQIPFSIGTFSWPRIRLRQINYKKGIYQATIKVLQHYSSSSSRCTGYSVLSCVNLPHLELHQLFLGTNLFGNLCGISFAVLKGFCTSTSRFFRYVSVYDQPLLCQKQYLPIFPIFIGIRPTSPIPNIPGSTYRYFRYLSVYDQPLLYRM